MSPKKRRKSSPEFIPPIPTLGNIASTTETTGLIPALPGADADLQDELYDELMNVTPPPDAKQSKDT